MINIFKDKLCLFLWFILASNFSFAELITSVESKFEQEESPSLISSVDIYLSRFLGKQANDENRLAAESFLKSLPFVFRPTCLYVAESDGLKLFCQIISKYTIKTIQFIGTPASLLEEEIRRKLPIQEGTSVNLDDEFNSSLQTVKSRVETFLKKSGYYGSDVRVYQKNNNQNLPLVDVIIKITNGTFARVNKVKVSGTAPINLRYVKHKFQRMCLSYDKIIESMTMGINCYSRSLESETTRALLDRFAQMGYVQARIRVSQSWINPNDQATKRMCRNSDINDPTPKCVDLRIEVDKGPLVRWKIDIKDSQSISRNPVMRILGSMFFVDQLSRASVPEGSDEAALDQTIIRNDLESKITFISARNIDEQEIIRSIDQMKDYLALKGYPDAEISYDFTQTESLINVNFNVFVNRRYFIESVRILPSVYQKYISEDQVNEWLQVRSIKDSGYITSGKVEDVKYQILAALKAKGFDTSIKSDLSVTGDGGVNVTFYISDAERLVVNQIIIENGISSIDQDMLSQLANCDNFKARENQENKCLGSSFVKSELEADAKRLEEEYKSQNYLYTQIDTEVKDSRDGKIIYFKVYDSRFGKKFVDMRKQNIKELIISGNLTTKTSVIERLFPYEDGKTILNPISLKKGLSNIRESRRFSPDINSSIIAGQEGSDDVYFAANLAEKPTLSWGTSISFSTDQFFMVESEIEETNLFSSMLRLNTSLGLGLFWGRRSILSNKLVWPFILGKNFQLTIIAPRIIYDDLTHLSPASRHLQSKVSAELEWKISTRIKPYLRYLLILNQDDTNPIKLPSIKDRLSSLDGLIPTIKKEGKLRAVLTPGVTYTSLDNLFDPRLGVDINAWSEISAGALMGNPPFVNVGLQNKVFFPIGPITIAMQASVIRSFITPSEDNFKDLKFNSFAVDKLGGDRSLRGYEEASIGVVSLPKNTQVGSYAGYISNTANIEMRFPLSYGDSLGRLMGTFFVDQGLLLPCSSLGNCHMDKKGFGLSAGASIGYSLPVGPISLAYGVSLLTGENRWHLLLGYTF